MGPGLAAVSALLVFLAAGVLIGQALLNLTRRSAKPLPEA